MDLKGRRWIYALLLVVALVMMVAGTATRKHGAVVVGLIVAAVNARQWLQWERRRAVVPGERRAP